MSMRLILQIISSLLVILFNSTTWTGDVKQAYWQTELLNRDVFTELPRK